MSPPPTYTSWINQVESWFGIITQKVIQGGSFQSVEELTRKVNAFVENDNAQANLCMWVVTAESILAKIDRLGRCISGTLH